MRIDILHKGQAERAASLQTAIQERVKAHTGGATTVLFGDPSVECDLIVYLGTLAAAGDSAIQRRLEEAIHDKLRLLPLVDNLDDYFTVTPDCLHPINGEKWSTAAEIAELVLRQVGLTDRDRRVFLSYRRKESTPVALQLFEKLHQAGYVVFLDYFSVDRGEVIQERIAQALEEMSFVLLLETKGSADSKWVAEEEIGYALNHRLGLMSLAWPEVKKSPVFPMIPPDRREVIGGDELDVDQKLVATALDRVMLRIEREHADQLRARRERIVADVASLLQAQGTNPIRLGAHSLLLPAVKAQEVKTAETVVRVCPRPANYWDLYELGAECAQRRKGDDRPNAWVVSSAGGYPETLRVAQWIAAIQAPEVQFHDPLKLPVSAGKVAAQ